MHWRGKSRIDHIESGLEALIEEIKTREIKSIAKLLTAIPDRNFRRAVEYDDEDVAIRVDVLPRLMPRTPHENGRVQILALRTRDGSLADGGVRSAEQLETAPRPADRPFGRQLVAASLDEAVVMIVREQDERRMPFHADASADEVRIPPHATPTRHANDDDN